MSITSNNLREYDPSINESNPSTAFIDLATYSALEKSLYSFGTDSKSYFVRETVKSSWFTQIPIKMTLNTSNPNFNQNFSADIPRSGDYLLQTWLRVTLNAVSIYNPGETTPDPSGEGNETLIWTPNFMHHLIEYCSLKINGMVVDELYSEHLDFLTAFMIPKGSRAGYNRMIGNFSSPENGMCGVNVCGVKAATYTNLNVAQELFLPLPFFFSRDTGLALPMAALPYADAKITFKFRNWDQLLSSIYSPWKYGSAIKTQLRDQIPKLSNVQVWGNYAIVSKSERNQMGCKPRDMIIEQNQQLNGDQGSAFLNGESLESTTSVDLRLKGAIKAIFFGCKNLMKTTDNPFRGSYATPPNVSVTFEMKISVSGADIDSKITNSQDTSDGPTNIHFNWDLSESSDFASLEWPYEYNIDPVGTATILYENTIRTQLENNYYSLIQPYYHAKNIPQSDTAKNFQIPKNPNEVGGHTQLALGYHMYSYALKLGKIDPCGSTNYGRLNNASLVITPTTNTVNDLAREPGSASDFFGPIRLFISALNHNVIRISGGTLGFPIL